MHGTTMIFLAIMPLSAAFFNYLVPLQIGARDVAFPRLNASPTGSSWPAASSSTPAWLVGDAARPGLVRLRQPHLDGSTRPGQAIDFWVLGLQILGVASLAAGFNFIVTILNMRAPGMTLMRMPIFSWMTLIVQILIVLAFPAITVP